MHISQIEPWTFFAKQNRKIKTLGMFNWKYICIDFEWPVNRRFCTRGWRPSKITPPSKIEFIQLCEKKQNSYVKNNPTGFQLCYRLYIFKPLIILLLSWRWIWLIGVVWVWQSILRSDRKVIQWDIVIHFTSLTFSWTGLSVFSPPGYPFLPKPPFQVFDFPGVQFFFIFIPYFFPNPFGSSESPYFFLGQST